MTHDRIFGTPVHKCALRLPVDTIERQPEKVLSFVDPTQQPGTYVDRLAVTEESCNGYFPLTYSWKGLKEELLLLSLAPLLALEQDELVVDRHGVACKALCRNRYPRQVVARKPALSHEFRQIVIGDEELYGLFARNDERVASDGGRDSIISELRD